ncbi:MAG: InlB B-repeat-containing protein, partial [Butyrivibrio sp.]|nr:InlB B-repeat-containing protein [Butyrivibrio sp.]
MRKNIARKLAMLLALVVLVTTCGSDYNSISVRATSEEAITDSDEQANSTEDNDYSSLFTEDIGDEQPAETEDVSEEPAVEETAPEEYVEPEAPAEEPQEVVQEETTEEAPAEEAAPAEETADAPAEENADAPAEEAAPADETPAEEAPAQETPEEVPAETPAETVETPAEVRNVTVTYTATKGGKVSRDSETIDLNVEGAAFEGATATARSDKYEFVNWTDAEGNEVSSEATFVPANIEADATFTANFKAAENIAEDMPALSVSDVHAGGMIVSVSAEEGIFPKDTEVCITGISEAQALETAQEKLGEDVKAAKGVDITFKLNGEEIQPADDRYVHVSLALEEAFESESLTVLHDHDGDVEQINASVSTDAEGNADGASFDANQFSVFIVADDDNEHASQADEHKVVTYQFYYEETLENEQSLKDGETLKDPGLPLGLTAQQEFKGWFVEGETERLAFPYEVSTESYTEDVTIVKVYASVTTTYYVSFHDPDDQVIFIKKAESTTEGEEEVYSSITVDDVRVAVDESEHKAFIGWTTAKNDRSKLVTDNSLLVDQDMHVYAYVSEAYYIHFDENDGAGGGASYTGPIFVEEGNTPLAKKPKDPTRKGYQFGGWYTSADSFTTSTEFKWDKNIEQSVTTGKEITLYARWIEDENTEYTIIVWKQKITDDVDADDDEKNYDYAVSYSKKDGMMAPTNSQVTVSGTKSAKVNVAGTNVYDSSSENSGDFYKGFHYSRYTVKDGKGADTTVVGRKGDTVINIYYDRNVMTIEFASGSGATYEETTDTSITPLYGKYGNDYVEVYYNSQEGKWGYDGMFSFHPIDGYTMSHGQGDGKLYKRTGQNIYKGLYGQRLAECGYTWPEGEWHEHNSSGTHLTFLDAFIFDNLQTEDDAKTKLLLVKTSSSSNSYNVEFLKQSVDGTDYYVSSADTQKFSGSWNITEKYSGFKYKEYSTNGGSSWKTDKTVGQTIKNNGNIQLRYERLKYQLTFMYGDEEVGKEQNVYYETPLNNFSEKANSIKASLEERYADSSQVQYKFVGWFEDKTLTQPIDLSTTTQTMPIGGKTVYAKFEPVRYVVTLHPNGGTLKDGQIASWNADWGDTVDKDSLMMTTREGYSLVGWFWYDTETEKVGDIFLFDTKVTSNIDLIAKWRNPGGIKVEYQADSTYGSGIVVPQDTYSYSTESTVRVLTRPTNYDDTKYAFIGWNLLDKDGNVIGTYYPNDCFDLTSNVVNSSNKAVLKALFEEKGGSGTSTETTTYVYSANFGENPQTTEATTVKINKPFTVLTFEETHLTAKPNARFLGWTTVSSNTTAEIIPGQKLVAADNEGGKENNILYAVWEDAVTITYKDGANQTVFQDISYPAYVGDATPTHADPVRPGWNFTGWDPEFSATVTGETTYTAQWEPDSSLKYTVTYAVEGNGDVDPKKNEDIQVLSTDEVTGSTATAEAGYKFDGWYNGDEQIADAETPELTADVAKAKLNKDGDGLNANTTYTAKFSVDESLTYKVTFESSDETMG